MRFLQSLALAFALAACMVAYVNGEGGIWALAYTSFDGEEYIIDHDLSYADCIYASRADMTYRCIQQ